MTIKCAPYFMLDGNAKEAIQFYKNTLQATVLTIQTYEEVNPSCPAAIKDRVAHAMLKVGESVLLFSDTPGFPIQQGNQLMVSISTNRIEASKRIFETLQKNGRTNSPLEKTPFSPAFGNVTDQFGITFQIFTEN